MLEQRNDLIPKIDLRNTRAEKWLIAVIDFFSSRIDEGEESDDDQIK